jgi:hypothetical protein
MASEALIRNHIDAIISDLSERRYRDWIADDIREIEEQRIVVMSGFRSDLTALTNESATLANNFSLFLKTSVYDYAKSLQNVVEVMKRYQAGWLRSQNRVKRTLVTTSNLCRDFEDNIGEYIPEVEVSEVVDQMEMEPLTADLPVIGPISIGFDEMAKRVARLGFGDLESYIESRINAMDYSGFPLRTRELTSYCYETHNDIEEMQSKIMTKHSTDLSALQGPAAMSIQHLSDLNVKSSPLVRQFSQLLTEVLGVAHSIEVEAPDISRDALFAKLISACDQGRRGSIEEIASILGVDPMLAQSMETSQLCSLLIESNFG